MDHIYLFLSNLQLFAIKNLDLVLNNSTKVFLILVQEEV
jgi:hypothetical protein